MHGIIISLSPIIFLFCLGVYLKTCDFDSKKFADSILNAVIKFGLPCLILSSINRADIKGDSYLIPIIAMLIIIVTFILSYTYSRSIKLNKETLGVFIISPLTLNIAIEYYIVTVFWGEDAISLLLLFDLGHIILVITFVYFIAHRYSEYSCSGYEMIKKLCTFPPLIALFASIALYYFDIGMPLIIYEVFKYTGHALFLLVSITLGIYFKIKSEYIKEALSIIFIRVVIGTALAWHIALLFDLSGLAFHTVIVAAAAPVGFTSFVYSMKANLNNEFSSSVVSLSLILSLIYLPIMLSFLTPTATI